MKKAVELAKEIARQETAIVKTKSAKLKHDYSKAIDRERMELAFYCSSKGLSLTEVYELARR